MKQAEALSLIGMLQEIQRLSQVLIPLIDENGRGAFQEFVLKLEKIVDKIFPTCTVAIAGPVNSGKSTLLSSLLKESGDHPIASIGPSNETFTPMVVFYGQNPALTLHYFGADVLQHVTQMLNSLKGQNAAHEVAQYKTIKRQLEEIEAIIASDPGTKIVRHIDLPWQKRSQLMEKLRQYTTLSAGKRDVYGIYKAEIAFPGKILRQLHNIRFVDLFGFGEPSPLIQMKYSRFISEEHIDALIYVFPDRAITDAFHNLFEIPGFIENIVAKGRLFLVLNKADAYTDVSSPNKWGRVVEEFRKNVERHVPILQRYSTHLPILVMSAASIDGKINHKKAKSIRKASLESLYQLRDHLRKVSRQIDTSAQDLSLYLSAIFDLLEVLDLLAEGARDYLARLEDALPEITQVLDRLSANESTFARERDQLLEGFRREIQQRLEEKLQQIDYESLVKIVPSELNPGESSSLFRGLTNQARRNVEKVYKEVLRGIFTEIAFFADRRLLEAYRKYVNLQDEAIRGEMHRLKMDEGRFLPSLRATVDRSAKELLKFSNAYSLHQSTLSVLKRFANWFLRNRYSFDTRRGQSNSELHAQVVDSVREVIETFMKVYVCEDPRLKNAFLPHISLAGEPTFWGRLRDHVLRLNRVLAEQIQITKWKFGLYQNKVFFISHKQEFHQLAQQLMSKKEEAQEAVIKLL